ncbi:MULTISPECIES: hypothetical protein [unclassified Blastococcus]
MRLSRVLLAGVAVAGVAATTSAFTASNNFSGVDNNVAGYGELTATGVAVSNIAYNPAADATKLASVVFTVGQDTSTMDAVMTLTSGDPDVVAPGSASTCVYSASGTTHLITCTLTTPVDFTSFDKTGLTVTSN